MTINATDIKLLESEIMADTSDGGGRRTSRIIPDAVAGNIFPKVSRLDSVYGRVNLRKVYGGVQTANTDTYAGAHAVVVDAPDNTRIHTTLFSTASEFDNRTAARDRIESYVTSATESRMVLLGRQLAGQQSLIVYQREEEPVVEIGEVLCISNEPGGVVGNQQYIRVGEVAHEVRTFEDDRGTFQRRVVTLDIGVPLRYTFVGPDTPSRYSSVTRDAKLRNTTVVDAARYFGIKPTAEAAAAGALDIKVASVYSPIVPTTNRETPLSNASMNGALVLAAAKATTVSETLAQSWTTGNTHYTRRPILPGSLVVSGSGFTASADDKKGVISHTAFAATVDYEAGTITRTGGSSGAGSFTLTYTPAGAASQTAHTLFEEIELSNRGTVYTFTMNPLPAPGSVTLDFRALGKWYRLRDNAAGDLAGSDASYGVGQVNYATGAVVVTLGALPDVGSAVLLGWGSPAHYAIKADATADATGKATQKIQLNDLPISPDSLSLTYTSNGTQYTATDNSSGLITGDGITGYVNYITGEVGLTYTTRLPDATTNVAFTYQQLEPTTAGQVVVKSLSIPAASTMQLGTAVVPGSFNASLPFAGESAFRAGGTVVVTDNGAGLLTAAAGQKVGVAWATTVTEQSTVGSIDYQTGTVLITDGIRTQGSSFSAGSNTWSVGPVNMALIASGTANLGWRDPSVNAAAASRTANVAFTTAPLRLSVFSTFSGQAVPGSLSFSMGGKTYIDRSGTLYYDVSNATGSGLTGGTIDYTTGELSLSAWANGASPSVSVISCLASYGRYSTTAVSFRTPGSPLRPGSFYVQATAEDGTLLTATSNDNGAVTGTNVSGAVDQEAGVVHLVFGAMVTAAGNEGADWFNAANVVNGMIFKPKPIIPATLTYNAVVLANLPLNADILGLDPVRLPMDGRVPIYRNADVVVIHNTASTGMGTPTAGSTHSAGRTNLAEMWVADSAGTKLASGQYATDLVNGTVTLAADFTLGTLQTPLKIWHRVEDMNLVTDVQINGQLSLASPLSRAYPAGTSFVSSALLFGDMNSRVTNVFDLGTFSTWSDVAGSGATAQYNNIDYPIEVLNNGAVTERWRINFTSTTAYQVIGENLGVIATGTTSADCSPVNQLTGNPYFVIRASGWGSGWAAGNQLRFNTISATAPIWIVRTVLPGATLEGDSFSMQVRGDVDAA